METNGIRRVPVIEKTENGHDKCVGMISLDDLIVSESVGGNLLSRIVRAQILRRLQTVRRPEKDQSHGEQTINRFNNILATKMKVSKSAAEQITILLLKDLVRRLPYTESAHFVAQLPSMIHEELLKVPAGPDLTVNEDSIINNLMNEFQLTRSDALHMAKKFWEGLEGAMDPGILEYVLRGIPEEMRSIFSDKEMTEVVFTHEINHAI